MDLTRGRALLLAAVSAVFVFACAEGSGEGSFDGDPPVVDRVEMESPAPAGSGEPSLHVGDDGRVYLTWFERVEGRRHALRFAVLQAGEEGDDGAFRWSAPRTISEGEGHIVNWADFPSMVALPGGRLVAHYSGSVSGGGGGYNLSIAWSLDGGESWSPPVIPHRDRLLGEHGFVSLFPLPEEAFGVVWLDGRGFPDPEAADEMTLRFASFTGREDAAEAMSTDVPLDGRVCECCQTAAAVTSAGPVVVYRDRSEEEVRDISIVRRVDGRWTEPATVHSDRWTIRGCPVNGPAADATGSHLAVAWFTAPEERAQVLVAFSDDAGASFAKAIRVDDGAPEGRAAIQMAGDGEALVGWLERAGEAAEIRVRRVRADGAASPAVTLAISTPERANGFPAMAVSGDVLIIAWTSLESRPARVRVARARIAAP